MRTNPKQAATTSMATLPSIQPLTKDELRLICSLTDTEMRQWFQTIPPDYQPLVRNQILCYETLRSDPELKGILEFGPQIPTWKQLQFLQLKCTEALYGGAAAGGKSSALMMGALQYVHVPKYSALILRTSITDLEQAGGLIPRSQQWLADAVNSKQATFNGNKHQWTFINPNTGKFDDGAKISFGYLGNSKHKYRYGSTEFQYIAFDELTEFPEEDYLFLFSRLRRTIDIPVPLRMRSGTNPGGVHGDWVKARFITKEAETDLKNDCLKDVYWKN